MVAVREDAREHGRYSASSGGSEHVESLGEDEPGSRMGIFSWLSDREDGRCKKARRGTKGMGGAT